MARDGSRANAGDRCFFCKAELLDVLSPLADSLGLAAVATGTNADDAVAGFRPGIRAAAERGALPPPLDAGPTKAGGRAAPRGRGLPTAAATRPRRPPGRRGRPGGGAPPPLRAPGLPKADVREAPRRWGLQTADKPA